MNVETHKRADPKLVAQCKAQYLTGRGTLDQCAERHGLVPVNIRNRAAREKWKEERDSKFASMVAPFDSDFNKRLQTFRVRSLTMIDMLEGKIEAAISEGAEAKKYDPEELGQLTRALDTLLTAKREVLGIPRVGTLKPADPNKEKPVFDTSIEPLDSVPPDAAEEENATTPLTAGAT